MTHDDIAEVTFSTIVAAHEVGITDPLRLAHAVAVALGLALDEEAAGVDVERRRWLKALDDSHLPYTYRRLVRHLALAPCGNCGGDAATCGCDES